MKYSVGIGVTNRCNYQCSHCYSRSPNFDEYDLAFEDIAKICSILDIEAVNFGTGESVLHPRFNDILDYLYEREIPVSLTTNGLSVLRLAAYRLKYFNDVDISSGYDLIIANN